VILDQGVRKALGRYDLGGNAEIMRQLKATHAAFQVRAGGRLYALRQFNPYMDVEDLRIQFLFAELMQAGLSAVSAFVQTLTGKPLLALLRNFVNGSLGRG